MSSFSLRLGVFGLGMMMIGLVSIRSGRDTKTHQELYATQGQTARGEVLSQAQTSHVRGRRTKTREIAYQLTVLFKLPDGTPVQKSLQVDRPPHPSADGKAWVTIRYLPQNPHDSAEVEGARTHYSGDGDEKTQSGLKWLWIGAIPFGIACLRERATIRSFFGKRA